MSVGQEALSLEEMPTHHAMESYVKSAGKWTGLAGSFGVHETKDVPCGLYDIVSEVVLREVKMETMYSPNITSAELVRVQSKDKYSNIFYVHRRWP